MKRITIKAYERKYFVIENGDKPLEELKRRYDVSVVVIIDGVDILVN